MNFMIGGCSNLNNLDLSSFNTKNVINMSYMFSNCPNNKYESNKFKFKKFKKIILTKWQL